MKPPRVYDVTIPKAHSTINTTKIVHSIGVSHLTTFAGDLVMTLTT